MTDWLEDRLTDVSPKARWGLAAAALAGLYAVMVAAWWAVAAVNTNVLPDHPILPPFDPDVWVRRPLTGLAIAAGTAFAVRVAIVVREHWPQPAEPADDEPQDAPTATPTAPAAPAPVPQPAPRKSGHQVPDYARAADAAVRALGGQATTAEIFARLKSSGALARLLDPPKDATELGNMLKKMGWANRRQARYPEYGYPEPTRLRFHDDYVKAERKYPWGVID